MVIQVSGSIRPKTTNTPLDARCVINSLADLSSIQLPFVGMLFTTKSDNKLYEVTALDVNEMLVTEYKEVYQKPQGGIPKTDLSSAVQASLDKADAAAPQATTYTKEECDERYAPISPAPPIHIEETIYYGFAGNDLSGVTGLTEEDVELPDTITRTVSNSTAGYSFYIAVPTTYSVQQVTQGGIEFPMGAAELITIDGISYKRYKSSEEGGYVVDNYQFTITIINN